MNMCFVGVQKMVLERFEQNGRRLMVEFECRRCKKTALRSLKTALSEVEYNFLTDLRPPSDWENGGFYYPLFCPDCSAAHKRFMNMEGEEDGK